MLLAIAGFTVCATAETRISIADGQWRINGAVTNPGSPAEGLLMNVRMVNATFEDRNARTCPPGFDADSNTAAFIANISDYAAQGVNAITLCLQGGMPGYEDALNSAFEPDGTLRPDYLRRVEKVIRAGDAHGVAVILGLFYQRQSGILKDDQAVRTAVIKAVRWVTERGFQNVVIEIANEYPHVGFTHALIRNPKSQAGLIRLARETAPGLLVSASGSGTGVIDAEVADAADFLLPHWNCTAAENIPARVKALQRFGKPIVCNEDDKIGAQAVAAMRTSVANGVGYGLMLKEHNQTFPFRFGGAADDPEFYAALDAITSAHGSGAPFPRSGVIESVKFDWSTHRRAAPGSDNWPLTWADDGHQYTAWGDGGGFGGDNKKGRVTLGVARLEGDADGYRGHNVWGGFVAENPATFGGKSYGILSVGGTLHMWVVPQPGPHLRECRLASSTDHGATWTQADWAFRFEDGLSIPTLLNFGRDYAEARDGFVYSYFIEPQWGPATPKETAFGFAVHRPGRIHLSRAPKDRLLQRDAHEFFAGLDAGGQPKWSAHLAEKRPVFTDANGVGWNVSVSYNAGLRRYLLATEHSSTHVGKFGLFDAPEPWGPWTTVAYDEAWGAGHVEVSAFFWSLPNKWLSADGRDFTMVFTGKHTNDSWNTVAGRFIVKTKAAADRSTVSDLPSRLLALTPSAAARLEAAKAKGLIELAPVSLPTNPPGACNHYGWPIATMTGEAIVVMHRRIPGHNPKGAGVPNEQMSYGIVLRSDDGGKTWSEPYDLRDCMTPEDRKRGGIVPLSHRFKFDPANKSTEGYKVHLHSIGTARDGAVMVINNHGVFRSEDAGRSWQHYSTALRDDTFAHPIVNLGPRLLDHPTLGLLAFGNWFGGEIGESSDKLIVLKSPDGGATWGVEEQLAGFPQYEPAVLVHDDQFLLVTRDQTNVRGKDRGSCVHKQMRWSPGRKPQVIDTNLEDPNRIDTVDFSFNALTKRFEVVRSERYRMELWLWSMDPADWEKGQWRRECRLLARTGRFYATADGFHPAGAVIDEERGVQHILIYTGHPNGPTGVFRLTRTLDTPHLAAVLGGAPKSSPSKRAP